MLIIEERARESQRGGVGESEGRKVKSMRRVSRKVQGESMVSGRGPPLAEGDSEDTGTRNNAYGGGEGRGWRGAVKFSERRRITENKS